MFSSIRSRLLLTYFLLIAVILGIVTLALILYLVSNPRLAREAETNLTLAADTLVRQRAGGPRAVDANNLAETAQEADQLLNVRVIVLAQNGELLANSRADTAPALQIDSLQLRRGAAVGTAELQDANAEAWLYTARQFAGGATLLVAVPRPRAPLLAFFSDELFKPIARAGVVALLLSIFLAFLLTRSITSPLQRVSLAADELAQGHLNKVKPEGPTEIRSLARSFNEMGDKVIAGQQSQRDFVANVSHELRTPLTSIQGFAQAILDGTARGGEAVKNAAQVIQNKSNRMQRLVQDLLELARLESGGRPLERHIIELGTLIGEVGKKFTPIAANAGVLLDIPKSVNLKVNGDYERLVQVFSNLVDNALKFSPRGGTVIMSASKTAKNIEVSITDSGPGVPAEEAKRIFERFYQVDKSRKTGAGRGAGLGLSIAKQIIDAHGGNIRVDSKPGQGATFIVRLPAS